MENRLGASGLFLDFTLMIAFSALAHYEQSYPHDGGRVTCSFFCGV